MHEEVFLASMNDSGAKSMNDWVVSACLEKLKHDQPLNGELCYVQLLRSYVFAFFL
ncbi:hypothetical protein [Piscirickettsia salmonis]|uniref:hypothetical protein n=1 Tax=Piscirickettsia salmonis TaxID=1238 RepID=UPI001F44F0D9|nr:hypothetical protein [Piscirickettsia salmonis]